MQKINRLKSGKALVLIIAGLLCSNIFAGAQGKPVTVYLDSIPFSAFIDTLEHVAGVRIFYTGDWADSMIISVHADSRPVADILSGILAGKKVYVNVLGRNVILTKDMRIKTDYKERILEYLKNFQPAYTTSEEHEEPQSGTKDRYKLYEIGNPAEMNKGKYATLSGHVKNGNTGKPAIGVVVYVPKIKHGTTTDGTGYYALKLTKGQHSIEFRSTGMHTEKRNLILYSDGHLDINIYEQVNQLREVTVSANRENKVLNLRMGMEKISMKMLKQIPMGLGEVDIVKSSLLLPGVQSVGEAAAGYNVRGGSTDENLILLEDAPIINSYHFFGFFSAFNSDVIDDVTLYKSGVPAKYGGRVSSVMDIRLKSGNPEKIKFSGGISPVTGRIMAQGPITKKANFVLGARSTFSDWLLKQLKNKQLQKSSARFYDLLETFNVALGKNDHLSLSGYQSRDVFNFYQTSAFEYSNLALTATWHHTFKPGLSAGFSAILSNYDYHVDELQDTMARSSLFYQLNQKIIRADFTWIASEKHKVDFGLNTTLYGLSPGNQFPLDDISLIMPKRLEKEQAVENALYVSDEWKISPLASLSGGIRLNLFASLGPGTQYRYAKGVPLSTETIEDTVSYAKGEITSFYPGPAYRITFRYLIAPELSVKAGVQRMYQYIHMISNTTAISPTDIWKLSNRYLKPTASDQFSVGVYKSMARNRLETSAEVYYKFLSNIVDYKNGAQLLMNEHLETDLLNGRGKAYGLELMIKKPRGSVTGWVSYTYARILHRVNGYFPEEKVNGGEWFPADYDKPQDVKVVVNAKMSRRFNVTANFMYSTGRPITYPAGYYRYDDVNRIFYSNRNEFRIPDYIRLDLAATLNGNLKLKKLNHSSFTLAVYNVLGRRNPYSIYFKVVDGEMKGYKLSIFGQPIITLTYNFRIFGNALGDF